MSFKIICVFLASCLLQVIASSSLLFVQSESYYKDNSFRTEDFTYDPYIKTVQLYPKLGDASAQLYPAIVPLVQNIPLELSFDELGDEARTYKAQIIRCESDWSESSLPPMEYLSVYNDFVIRDYEYSINTKVPYVHYTFDVPKVKLSGNYVIKVFFEEEENLILTRRFMVFEDKATVGFKETIPMGGEEALRNQQFEMKISYGALEKVINPNEQVKVTVRQNYRWDNAKQHIKPTFIKEHDKILDYSSLGKEYSFRGGNEFRMFDFRSPQRFGWRVDSVRYQKDGDRLFVQKDISRLGFTYGARMEDLNGQYYVETLQNPSASSTEADYVYVTFVLNVAKIAEEVFIFGELSEWQLNPLFKMRYQNGIYTAEVLLKQGVYNYMYVRAKSVEDKNVDTSFFESSYRQTKNTYDVLVYYRPMGSRTDYLVGYRKVDAQK